MPILDKLFHLYRRHGHHVVCGIPPEFSLLPYTDFTYIVTSDGRSTDALGIAPAEVCCFEHLVRDRVPANILIVGNSFGWSTFALSLMSPGSRVVALELGGDPFTLAWIAETNRIARAEGLDIEVVHGKSPDNIGDAVARFGGSKVDLAFIDGLHTNDQVVLDFVAIAGVASANAVYLFHDVIYWNLLDGLHEIENIVGRKAHYLYRTPSGIAVLASGRSEAGLASVLEAFEVGPMTRQLYLQLRAGRRAVDISMASNEPEIADVANLHILDLTEPAAMSGEGRLLELRRRLDQKGAEFDALLEDRRKAQEIMEYQARLIEDMRRQLSACSLQAEPNTL